MADLDLKLLYSREQIAREVKRIGAEINRDFAGEEVILVAVLKGALLFVSDLMRELDLDARVDFIRLASYGSEMVSSGVVEIRRNLEFSLRDRNVIVVEDIVDSGNTLEFLYHRLQQQQPRCLKICTLIDKRARREAEIEPDYAGLVMDDGFIVGYGLDYDEKYRNLPEIYVAEP